MISETGHFRILFLYNCINSRNLLEIYLGTLFNLSNLSILCAMDLQYSMVSHLRPH